MSELDTERVSRVITETVNGPGGIALAVNVFVGIPGVVHAPAKRGMFRSEPERILIGDWRYEVARDGRLHAAHVVNGIVIAEETLAAGVVGSHVTRALAQIAARYGQAALPAIDAAVDALDAGS
jgi:hypothetical protein